jgi:hypothetical protein
MKNLKITLPVFLFLFLVSVVQSCDDAPVPAGKDKPTTKRSDIKFPKKGNPQTNPENLREEALQVAKGWGGRTLDSCQWIFIQLDGKGQCFQFSITGNGKARVYYDNNDSGANTDGGNNGNASDMIPNHEIASGETSECVCSKTTMWLHCTKGSVEVKLSSPCP